jgi:hypothetical protein
MSRTVALPASKVIAAPVVALSDHGILWRAVHGPQRAWST